MSRVDLLRPTLCSCTTALPVFCRANALQPNHSDHRLYQVICWTPHHIPRPGALNAYNLVGYLKIQRKVDHGQGDIFRFIFFLGNMDRFLQSQMTIAHFWDKVRSGSKPVTRQIGDSPCSSTNRSQIMILAKLHFQSWEELSAVWEYKNSNTSNATNRAGICSQRFGWSLSLGP